MVGAFFVLLVLWLFISQWLRVTVFVSAMVVWLAVSPLLPAFTLWPSGQPTTAAATTAQANTGANAAAGAASSPANSDIPPQTEPPTSANLTNWLNAASMPPSRSARRRSRTSCRRMRSRLTCW